MENITNQQTKELIIEQFGLLADDLVDILIVMETAKGEARALLNGAESDLIAKKFDMILAKHLRTLFLKLTRIDAV